MLEKTLESPLDSKEIKSMNTIENQPWTFTGRTDAEAEAPILWPHDVKNQLIEKDPDAGKGWGQEEKGTIEDEMVGWHHWLNGRGFGWTLGVGDGQGGLACYSPWSRQESDTTEWLNWTESKQNKTKFRWIWDSLKKKRVLIASDDTAGNPQREVTPFYISAQGSREAYFFIQRELTEQGSISGSGIQLFPPHKGKESMKRGCHIYPAPSTSLLSLLSPSSVPSLKSPRL